MAKFLTSAKIAAPAALTQAWLDSPASKKRLHPVWEEDEIFLPRWRHEAVVKPEGKSCVIEDMVEYSHAVTAPDFAIEERLGRVFSYRYAVARHDLELQAKYPAQKGLRILISGSSGMIGQALIPKLKACGHEVVRLVRGEPSEGELHWEPMKGVLDHKDLEGFDAVVHLAGESIAAGRWTKR